MDEKTRAVFSQDVERNSFLDRLFELVDADKTNFLACLSSLAETSIAKNDKELVNTLQENGLMHTPNEIQNQSEHWSETVRRTTEKLTNGLRKNLENFLERHDTNIIFTGAGSSHFIGDCLAPAIRRATGCMTISIASTEIVSYPADYLGQKPLVLISLARSGDSPESEAVYNLANRIGNNSKLCQVIITCNEQGKLIKKAREDAARPDRQLGPLIVLDEDTNDKGLAMTSSFTNLFLSGLGLAYLNKLDEYQRLCTHLVQAGQHMLKIVPQKARELRGFKRIVFLGSGGLLGAAREASLKVLEMTDGQVPSLAHSYLGLRHGPLSFVNEDTLVVAFRTSDQYTRKYESDLLCQLDKFTKSLLVVEPSKDLIFEDCFSGEHRIFLQNENTDLPDTWLPALAVPVGQILALMASLENKCRPDAPCDDGRITRVVKGVTIYDEEWSLGPA